jgi:integrase/recombinase XerD
MGGKELTSKEYGQGEGAVGQAENDNQVLAMWLHGRPKTTTRAYFYEIQRMLSEVGKPLQRITLGDLQGCIDNLTGLSPASQARGINAIKSLFSFAQRIA